jgi:ubiquinone biosynthesis protein Coq4
MLDEQNLTPDFLPDIDIDSDFDYYKRRSQQTHDIEHIVTGFLYDPIGEWGLIATKGSNLMTYLGVELTRHLNVFSQFLLSTGLSRVSLHYPQMIPPVFRAIGSGEKLGREMKPIFTPRYEEMFDWPVDDVRSTLDIVLPGGREDTMWSLNTYFERE